MVLRLEGLRSEQDPYRVPRQGQDRHVEGTQSDQQTGTVGLSWVDAQGFAGLAYTRQQRQYGEQRRTRQGDAEPDRCHRHGQRHGQAAKAIQPARVAPVTRAQDHKGRQPRRQR